MPESQDKKEKFTILLEHHSNGFMFSTDHARISIRFAIKELEWIVEHTNDENSLNTIKCRIDELQKELNET